VFDVTRDQALLAACKNWPDSPRDPAKVNQFKFSAGFVDWPDCRSRGLPPGAAGGLGFIRQGQWTGRRIKAHVRSSWCIRFWRYRFSALRIKIFFDHREQFAKLALKIT
jgi:hypothetical protein